MAIKHIKHHFLISTLSLGLAAPALAETTEDELGQFLNQNFPSMNADSKAADDPIREIANRSAQTITPVNNGGNFLPTTNSFQQQNMQYDFVGNTAAKPISNTNFGAVTERNFIVNSGSPASAPISSSYSYAPFLNARSALVMNANTGKILYQKNMDTVRPIASISKLMSAMVLLDAKLNMYEDITITADEIDRLKGTGSRLSIGTTLTRGELLHLGLMSSENRAIHALGRTYPGGMPAFVAAMNAKARSLGMNNSRFYEPTGLDPRNVSTARDLSVMVRAANKYPQIRSLSTSNYGQVYTSAGRMQTFKNTNSLVREGSWDISLQKTGYIKEAGRSMVLQAQMGTEPVVIVVLGSTSSSSRVNDARTLSTMIHQTPL
ncbi:D-alanyl-D-alanine carboxypeptidase family protein [Alysiella crassa]|uniref:D-alanyl-D-alanine endopeptidase n=1 Tax=Alysiella crassa TaxID=153491 RepID=A0A376BW42_9NEIS|nr:serine hydrolase [Alysiella crassa]UOP06593.1 serine hydrolase [Alysiella crassa]SSY81129.1 D-alanyl-D-alanine endopeptidase precursor [Alysiella crassa]